MNVKLNDKVIESGDGNDELSEIVFAAQAYLRKHDLKVLVIDISKVESL